MDRKNAAPLPTPRTTRDWHLFYVGKDTDFLAAKRAIKTALSSGNENDIDAIKKETGVNFHLSPRELNQMLMSDTIYLDMNEKTTKLDIDTDKRSGTITFDLLSTSKEEILEEFSAIEAFREQIWKTTPKKRRAPEHPDLIYAIFKARQAGKTYPEIYTSYKAGKLKGWTKKPIMFTYAKMLENYYRQYQP